MKNWLNTGSHPPPHPDPGILTWRVWHLYNDLYLTKNRADLYKSFVTVVSLYKQTPVDFWKSSEFWVRTLFRTPDADYRSKPNSLTCMAYSWAHSAKENVLCPEFSNTTCWFTFLWNGVVAQYTHTNFIAWLTAILNTTWIAFCYSYQSRTTPQFVCAKL